MLEFSIGDLGLEIDLVKPPITLGAIATKYLLKVWKDLGIEEGQVNGFRLVKQSRFNKNVGSGRANGGGERLFPSLQTAQDRGRALLPRRPE